MQLKIHSFQARLFFKSAFLFSPLFQIHIPTDTVFYGIIYKKNSSLLKWYDKNWIHQKHNRM